MSIPLLSIQNLEVEFTTGQNGFRALNGISFDVAQGAITAVVGESGSGKSVCALSILQLLPGYASYTGTISMQTDPAQTALPLLALPHKQLRQLRGNKIGMIFQEPMTSLNPVFTCGDQVAEVIRLHKGGSRRQARIEVIRLFERVKLPDPENMFDRYPHQLSGGQKQRVMIAMAMSCQPALLIADEPTTALDVTVQQSILQLIKELQLQQQMAVVFITHDLGLVAEIADSVVVLYKGTIVEQGEVDRVFRWPQHPYTKALLQCRPAQHAPGERLPTVADFMSVAPDGSIVEKQRQPDRTTVIETNVITDLDTNKLPVVSAVDVKVWFQQSRKSWFNREVKYVKAVDGVDLQVFPGEVVGLVGESGCGKTTLGRALLRLVEPSFGKIFFGNTAIRDLQPEDLRTLRRKMQIVFQDPYSSLNPRLTIGAAIMEVMQVHRIGNGSGGRRENVIHLLEKVGLQAAHFNRYPHQFSGGQKQRIGIARTLALQPDFIVWDESVSALDVSVQAQVLNLINDLRKEFGFASLFISHDLSVVRYISNRILVMYKGKIVESGPATEVYTNPQSDYTRTLLAALPSGDLLKREQ